MLLLAVLALALFQAEEPRGFEPATPESAGLDPARLDELGAVVQGYVDAGKVVGAELAVIRRDQVVFHRGYGWKHREEDVTMAPGGVFCLRSMTKAVVGTAVQMLIDEKALAPGDPVAKYLPSFDNERSRAITIGQLLTHTSGLPLSSLLSRSLSDFDGERAIADLTGENGPEFPPGERFSYSDDGADVLGALVEVVSGKSLETFLEERIFGPLGMRETACVMSVDHPLRERACSNYVGSTGNWTRFWSPTDPPIFQFLLASQGLYGSVLDYARFLRLWRDGGRVGGKRLLSGRALWRALEPENAMEGMPTGFSCIELHYGQMMQLWIDLAAEKKDRLYAFGHGGSDGTMAWVFPELDLIVLYFTQSRNGLTSIEIGEAVQRLVVDPLIGAVRAPLVTYTPAELDAFAGLYWEEEDTEYMAILRRDEGLFLEVPGMAILELVSTRTRDHFELKFVPGAALSFERGSDGTVTACTATHGGSEHAERLVPAADLPSVDEVMARKKAASDWEEIDELGGVRVRTQIDLEKLELHGDGVLLARGREFFRIDNDFGTEQESFLWRDGRGWSWTSKTALEELTGARLTQLRQDHPFATIEDWRVLYAKLEVLARVEHRLPGSDSKVSALLLRAEPRAGNAYTWIVAEETGLPLALLSVEQIPGMGELGSVTDYADWREVGGLKLPFRRTASFATPLLGEFVSHWQEVETGVEIDEELLELKAPREDEER